MKFEKESEKSAMSSAREASDLVRQVAEPRPVGDSVKSAIGRAARRLGFGFSRTRDLWYEHARRIHADEIDRLRDQATRREAALAVANLLALRNRLAAIDPRFHRPTIDALEHALAEIGGAVGPVVLREG